jgi:hypothetical protein
VNGRSILSVTSYLTFIGRDLDDDGKIVSPPRADWQPGSAFVTPPGLWHAHH